MGTIRNRMVIVHEWDLAKITKLREDAVKIFGYLSFSVFTKFCKIILTGK